MNRNFGHLISRLRKERGWKLNELAERSGLSPSLLSRYERGERGGSATNNTIQALSKAFNVSEDIFIIAEGRIPWRLYSILCQKHPHQTLSIISALAAKLTNDNSIIEEISRDLLLRYYNLIGHDNFHYPIDIKDLLFKVHGIEVLWESFNNIDQLSSSANRLCGILIPEKAKLGNSFFHRVVLLNSDLLNRDKNGNEIARFTMAHEAFHQEIHQVEQSSQNSPNIENIIYCRIQDLNDNSPERLEYKANRFAGSLLIPSKDLYNQIASLKKPLDLTLDGRKLLLRYGVTLSALKFRLDELKISYFLPDSKQLSLWD